MDKSPLHILVQKGLQKALEEQQVPLQQHMKVVQALSKALAAHKADINLNHVLMNRHALQLTERDQATAQEREAHKKQLVQYENKIDSYEIEIARHKTLLKGEAGKHGNDGISPSIDEILSRVIPLIPIAGKGKAGKDAIFDKDSFKKEMVEYIRKEKPLDISHIKGAQEFVMQTGQKNIKIKMEELLHGGGGSGGGTATKSIDLSAQCTGSNKAFNIPSFTTALSLMGSDAPIVYRPITDWSASATTLTLTAAVNAPSAGATLIFTYA